MEHPHSLAFASRCHPATESCSHVQNFELALLPPMLACSSSEPGRRAVMVEGLARSARCDDGGADADDSGTASTTTWMPVRVTIQATTRATTRGTWSMMDRPASGSERHGGRARLPAPEFMATNYDGPRGWSDLEYRPAVMCSCRRHARLNGRGLCSMTMRCLRCSVSRHGVTSRYPTLRTAEDQASSTSSGTTRTRAWDPLRCRSARRGLNDTVLLDAEVTSR